MGLRFERTAGSKRFSVEGKKVTVQIDEQVFHANALIVTAGAWSKDLREMLGLELPLTPTRKTFAWFDADEALYNDTKFPAFAFETKQGIYYGFPSIEGAGLKVGRHDGGVPINPDSTIEKFGGMPDDQADLVQFLNQYIPKVGELNYGKTCMYTVTPDEKFIIDLHPKHENVAIATGFSGHGFKFSSAVGQALSNLISLGKHDIDLSPFSIQRFHK